ncbi:ABC transporter ATP-binding protein [Enterobacter cloacae]|uniref:ABC transporter ATP-binding protein n=1 Tax=Enterobacter cloacae TaxID=550 RepID=A0A377M9M3_ENTCL|nr:ABC transporter ATP-binding protein [Enterobacter cloacae]
MAQFVYTMHRVGKVVPPKRHILKNISLSFFPGAKIGVLGLNGAGKSTLLRIMAGIDTDIEGEARPQPGIKIGYLPQEPQLNPEHTVRESVEEAVSEVVNALKGLDEVYANTPSQMRTSINWPLSKANLKRLSRRTTVTT